MHNLIQLPLSWQQLLSNAITNPAELIEILELDHSLLEPARLAGQQFNLRVPRGFVARMQKGNLDDPLLRQVLPLDAELTHDPSFSQDPLAEVTANPIPGLLHKYHGRVLLVAMSVCGVNCRYCFRRHFPYDDNNPGTEGWEKALAYIAQDDSIKEVILSGGDPLVAGDKRLRLLSEKLAAIPHVTTLRIHSRMPIVIPERITAEFLSWFTQSRLRPVMVFHCNHAQEIDHEVQQAFRRLRDHNVTLLNQAVLLKGVNDSVATLAELSERLFDNGVLPYYLHLLDKVQGAAHFDVSATIAQQLIAELMQQLPGYLVPKLVYEKAGAASKLGLSSGVT